MNRAPRTPTTLPAIIASAIAALTPGIFATDASAQSHWPALARDAARTGLATGLRFDLASPVWTITHLPTGEPIDIVGPVGPVATADTVIVLAEIAGDDHLLALDPADGSVLWHAPVPPRFLDSTATPVISTDANLVAHASDFSVTALDLATGVVLWQTDLLADAVNASPIITADLGPRDRLFITDYDPFLAGARLYCINVDPFDASLNPHQPGDIVWSVGVGSAAGGSPAYHSGVVFVPTAGLGGFGAGSILAFDATADTPPTPLWSFTNTKPEGFFGGLSLHESQGQLSLFAASYAFTGTRDSANLVKLDADTGDLVWSVNANRTNATPIPLGDRRILLSTGIDGFGTTTALQLFLDRGDTATRLWDSALATWTDTNANGSLDPGEFLRVGAWNHQPALLRTGTGLIAYTARAPLSSDPAAAAEALAAIDLSFSPRSGAFVDQQAPALGNSPAIAGNLLLTTGPAGVAAFAPLAAFDVDHDGVLTIDDLHAWEQGRGDRDINQDQTINSADRALLIAELRRREPDDQHEGRR